MKETKIRTSKLYNQQQTAKWKQNWNDYMNSPKNHPYCCSPQLAFYIFEKNYGYVLSYGTGDYWKKTKKECLKKLEELKAKELLAM